MGIGTLCIDSQLIISPQEKAEALKTYFQSVFSQLSTEDTVTMSDHPSDMTPTKIDENEVRAQLLKLIRIKQQGLTTSSHNYWSRWPL